MHAIGHVSKVTGLKVPTIRFYEHEGLLSAPDRGANGRRIYSEDDVRRLAFIRHARALGFELDDVRSLLDLSDNPTRSCAEADAIASAHLAIVEARIAQLTQLKTELNRIVRSCAGGRSAGQCRVIEALTAHDQCLADHDEPKRRGKASAKRPGKRK